MIHIIQNILVLIQNHMNYLQDHSQFWKKKFFFLTQNPRSEEQKIIKDIRNLFRLKERKLKEWKI